MAYQFAWCVVAPNSLPQQGQSNIRRSLPWSFGSIHVAELNGIDACEPPVIVLLLPLQPVEHPLPETLNAP